MSGVHGEQRVQEQAEITAVAGGAKATLLATWAAPFFGHDPASNKSSQLVGRLLGALDELPLVLVVRGFRPGCARRTPRTAAPRAPASSAAMPRSSSAISLMRRLEPNVSRTSRVTPRSISRCACRRLRARTTSAELREIPLGHLHHPQRLLQVVECHHQHAGALGAGGAEQVRPRRVAVIDLVAETADHLHLFGVLLQRGEGDAAHPQDAADDLPDPAEAADDDGARRRRRSRRRPARADLQARDQQPLRRGEQQRG